MELSLSTIQSVQNSNNQNPLQITEQQRFDNASDIQNPYASDNTRQISPSTKYLVSKISWEAKGMIQLYILNLDAIKNRQNNHSAVLIVLKNCTKQLSNIANQWNLFIDKCSKHGWSHFEGFQVLCQKCYRLLQGPKNLVEEFLLGDKPALKRFQILYKNILVTKQIFAQKINKFQENLQNKEFPQQSRIMARLSQTQMAKVIDKKQIQDLEKDSLPHELKLSKKIFRQEHEGQFSDMEQQEERKKIRKNLKNQQSKESCPCSLM